MKITFVGTTSCIPESGAEVASFVIDGKHLVDTGWCAALKMRDYGINPLAIESLILTHLHQDHYMGLPALLFFAGIRRTENKRPGPLRIAGPGKYLAPVVDAAVSFLQIPRFPELTVDYQLMPLSAGDSFALGELRFTTCAALHESGANRPEPALVYKVTDAKGACFVFTGDTAFHPPIAEFAKCVPLLIHDGCHTRPRDAARIARMAGVGGLVLIHAPQSAAAQSLAEAQEIFPNTRMAREGETIEV